MRPIALFWFLAIPLTDYSVSASKVLDAKSNPHNLAWLFNLGRSFVSNHDETSVCNTEECDIMAKIIKNSMDEMADPCQDFYQYACGKWGNNNPIPADQEVWSFARKAGRNVQHQVLELLESDSDPDDLLAVKLGKRYYRTCMDRERIERTGLAALITTLARIGGWPLIMEPEEWDEDKYTWQSVDDYYSTLTGKNVLHTISIDKSYPANVTTVTVHQPSLPPGSFRLFKEEEEKESSEEIYSEEADSQEVGSKEVLGEGDSQETLQNTTNPRKEYADLIAEIALLIAEARGFELERKQIDQDIEDMLTFIINLREAINYPRENEEMSLLELHEWYNNLKPTSGNAKIDWLGKIMLLFNEANVEIDNSFMIIIGKTSYFQELRSLLEKTPSRTIVNYIHWHFISTMLEATTKQMQLLHQKLLGLKGKLPTIKEEWSSKCISEIEMMDIMSYTFVKKYFPDKILRKAEEMIGFVQQEVERQISQSKWLSENFKTIAIEKVKSMKKEIGYPSWYKNTTIMKNYYKGLIVGPSYFENRLSYSRYDMWNKLRSAVSSIETKPPRDFFFPLMLNAMYAPFSNVMFVTAADFQNPLFALSRPSVINFGIIGAIIGHEISHGFDANGVMFDGGERGRRWYLKEEGLVPMAEEYMKRVECFVEQYNNYTGDNESATNFGGRTKNENIADTMGLEATLGGYYLSRGNDTSEQALPGLEKFTSKQLFYISYAVLHCEVISEKGIKRYAKDVHSTHKLRVMGPISNSENFADSFNCPVGSPMNPKHKCNIWN
ncbi:hypothetical protein KM043_015729 [Ampulex compressa]|nr:hypothetical protein KM043_015729 [Ampulex compressa]